MGDKTYDIEAYIRHDTLKNMTEHSLDMIYANYKSSMILYG